MPVSSYKLGPGSLTIGDGAGAQSIEAQLANARIEWSENVTQDDDLNLLDGGQLLGDSAATYRSTLAGKLVQDLDLSGFLFWTWAEKGNEHPFVFVPNDVAAVQVTGTLVVAPVNLGGDVKTRPTSDFVFRCVSDLTPAAVV